MIDLRLPNATGRIHHSSRPIILGSLLLATLLLCRCAEDDHIGIVPVAGGLQDSTRFLAQVDSFYKASKDENIPLMRGLTEDLISSPFAAGSYKHYKLAHELRAELMCYWLREEAYENELDTAYQAARSAHDSMRVYVLLLTKALLMGWEGDRTGELLGHLEEAQLFDPEHRFSDQDNTWNAFYAEATSEVGLYRRSLGAALRMSEQGSRTNNFHEEYWGLLYGASACYELGLNDSVMILTDKARQLFGKSPEDPRDVYAYMTLAKLARKLGHATSVRPMLDSAAKVAHRVGVNYAQLESCQIEEAWSLIGSDQPARAIERLRPWFDGPNAEPRLGMADMDFWRVLDAAYHATGDHERAYDCRLILDSLTARRNFILAGANLADMENNRREQLAEVDRRQQRQIQAMKLEQAETLRNVFVGGFVIVALCAVVFLRQRVRIKKEHARSEGLLLNILPEEVAEELKAHGEAEARHFDHVTVLFTDFKGFTAMSETLSPQELVRDLNECFSAFDRICEKHGIEKIKTIGDAYMAAGGLPTPNTTHASDVIRAAFEMRDFIAQGKAQKVAAGLPFFEIRIGIHTGPVVAGIVGVKKFSYDIWGDTVNTASRMESSGEVGQINISDSTYELVKDKFTCTHRGKVAAKGKGEIDMYFVEGRI